MNIDPLAERKAFFKFSTCFDVMCLNFFISVIVHQKQLGLGAPKSIWLPARTS